MAADCADIGWHVVSLQRHCGQHDGRSPGDVLRGLLETYRCPQPRSSPRARGAVPSYGPHMDTRSTRRDARRAARDLLDARADLVSDLAASRAALLAAEAHLADAQGRRAAAAADYKNSRQAAIAGGWTNEDLSTLGYVMARQPRQDTTRNASQEALQQRDMPEPMR